MKIYVCGGSSELDLVTEYMDALRHAGHVITHDWVRVIRERGEANPRNDTHDQRRGYSSADLQGIEDARIVWALLPARTSFGCAFEIGHANGFGKYWIVSGDWRASIFTAQARARFDSHADALRWLHLFSSPPYEGSESEMQSLEAR